MPLSKRYALLVKGIAKQMSSKLGFPLLIGSVLLNILLLSFHRDHPKVKTVLQLFKWIAVFIAIYTVLLPLGGYREYRPHIIRADSYLAVTLCLMYCFGLSSLLLASHLKAKFRAIYIAAIGIILFIFVLSDEPKMNKADCEKAALQSLYRSEEKINTFSEDCIIMSWIIISNAQQSKLNAKLLKRWNIVWEGQLYVQQKH